MPKVTCPRSQMTKNKITKNKISLCWYPFGALHNANCNQQGPSADMWGYPEWRDTRCHSMTNLLLIQGQGHALQRSWGFVGDSISSVSMNWDIWAMLLRWTHSVNKVLVRYYDLAMLLCWKIYHQREDSSCCADVINWRKPGCVNPLFKCWGLGPL